MKALKWILTVLLAIAAILNAIVKDDLGQYAKHSIFAKVDWDQYDDAEDQPAFTPDAVAQMILVWICCILHDPHISRARKMLVMERIWKLCYREARIAGSE